MLVVYHSETALGVVVENYTANYLVWALHDADAEVAFLEKTKKVRVVVKLIQSFPHFFRLTLYQCLKFLYII